MGLGLWIHDFAQVYMICDGTSSIVFEGASWVFMDRSSTSVISWSSDWSIRDECLGNRVVNVLDWDFAPQNGN